MESPSKLSMQTTSTSPSNVKRILGDNDGGVSRRSPKISKNEAMEDSDDKRNDEDSDEDVESDPNSVSIESGCSSTILDLKRGEIDNENYSPSRFDGYDFPHSSDLRSHVHNTFKLKQIRSNQLLPINAVMLGHNCFVTMSSASGKSLIYQLPAIMQPGVTIVISPLIALIRDQVIKLKSLGIKAEHVEGGSLNEQIFTDLFGDKPETKIIYTTPEKIGASDFFVRRLKDLSDRRLLERIVVDEAQSIVQFEEFREEYSKLDNLRVIFPDVPWTLLTGNVTSKTRRKIIKMLKLKDSIQLFTSNVDRPNLRYMVIDKRIAIEIGELINERYKDKSGIIYCSTKNEADNLVQKLKSYEVMALSYHSDMEIGERRKAQKKWMNNEVKVMCATLAFGMGIDKPDVGFIIHSSLPQSILQYYTDCGQAGRNGEIADCILYYDKSDLKSNSQITDIENMRDYCENKMSCRRELLLKYFGKSSSGEECIFKESRCDNCAWGEQ